MVFQAEAMITSLNGRAPSFAGRELIFYQTVDWISGSEEVICKCKVSDSGEFSMYFDIQQTIQLHTYLGVYLGYFFAEPGKDYKILLPERKDKTPEDALNPYFEPVELHLGMSDFCHDDLNMLIMMFDDAFVPYYDKHVNNAYGNVDMSVLDEDIRQIEEPFVQYSNAFFKAYRIYHYGFLKLLASRQKVQSLSDEYFNDKPVLYAHPAYADLFQMVFDKYFIFLGRTREGSQIFNDINISGNYHHLLSTLGQSHNFSNDTLTELIVLKQIHDEYYGSQFSRSGLLKILDSLRISTSIEEHKIMAGYIYTKLTRLQAGFEPPAFELYDTEGTIRRLSDFKGQYVYLNFCTCQSYGCLNEFNLLADLHRKMTGKLMIVTITTDPMEAVLKQFLDKNHYNWTFLLYDNQPGILKEYDIRAFPTYFLIGPDGKLIFSPAASPSENFIPRLAEAMRLRGDL
jgi:peroxiredoxin